MNIYQLESYQFHLPEELIAQQPVYPRDRSRLMIVDRKKGTISETIFNNISEILGSKDQLIMNNTKVIPARLIGFKETGGKVEIFLSKERSYGIWEVMAKPAKKVRVGTKIVFNETFSGHILEVFNEGLLLIKFNHVKSFREELQKAGQIPLPHYIKRNGESNDHENYQTLFAKNDGAVAAPTAGLHFTKELLNLLQMKGVDLLELTLHVGLGTFKPIVSEDIRNHLMHSEIADISVETARCLNENKTSGLQIAVGTTSCRALESAFQHGKIQSGTFETNLFIYPGYEFKFVKSLLTNFHLPGSSLLMLVSAFAGVELIKEAYAKAIEKKFRFFSYGDAMLIL